MKRVILIFLTSLIVSVSYSQTTVQMEEHGGVYKIPCLVNGVKMKLVFDTGASSVCLSETMAYYMYENDYLNDDDILESGTSIVADGREVSNTIINLKEIEIAGLKLTNIKASVIEGQNAPLLLGQSVIQQLGAITIDGNRLTIHNGSNDITPAQLSGLYDQFRSYYYDGYYSAAIESLLKIESYVELDDFWLYFLANCYYFNRQFDKCISTCERWRKKYDTSRSSSSDKRSSIYDLMVSSYYFGVKDYNKAILWCQKQLAIDNNSETRLSSKNTMANAYSYLADYYTAIRLHKEVVKEQCEYLGITIDDVKQNRVNNNNLGLYLCGYAFTLYGNDNQQSGDEVMSLAAKCGYELAIDYCKEYNIPYRNSSNLFE